MPRLEIRVDISFIVDTGADRSLLCPMDGQRIGVDYSVLTGNEESVGLGGISYNFVERAILAFSEARRTLHLYFIELQIAAPTPEISSIPSILGRDVLDRWHMTYNPSKSYLAFRVLSADYSIPIER